MAKGFFMQGVCLLTDGTPTIDSLRSALESNNFSISKQIPAGENWCFGGPSVVIPFRPDDNGYVAVDVVEHFWPDSMGDPKKDLMIFGAWALGQFGPLTFPRGLARACQQCWHWNGGKKVAESHRGFIRIRLSYVFGTPKDAPVAPKNQDQLAELHFLNRVVGALQTVPGVLCYFNPNGETLYDAAGFKQFVDESQRTKQLPLPLWMNVRLFNLSAVFGLMDTVGNGQLDLPDVEAIYPKNEFNPNAISNYLRNVFLYLLQTDRELKSGETIDGPGETNLSWVIQSCKNGLCDPPRSVLRLFPKKHSDAIRIAIAKTDNSAAND